MPTAFIYDNAGTILHMAVHRTQENAEAFAQANAGGNSWVVTDDVVDIAKHKVVNSNVVTRPVAEVLAVDKRRKLQEVNRLVRLKLQDVRSGYTADEIASWGFQLREVDLYDGNPNAATPLLNALAASRGMPKAAVVAAIKSRVAAYSSLTGGILGNKQRLEDAISAAGTPAALDAIDIQAGWV